MNLQGNTKFDIHAQKLWDSLHDEEILKKVIPGCEQLVLNESGEYDVI